MAGTQNTTRLSPRTRYVVHLSPSLSLFLSPPSTASSRCHSKIEQRCGDVTCNHAYAQPVLSLSVSLSLYLSSETTPGCIAATLLPSLAPGITQPPIHFVQFYAYSFGVVIAPAINSLSRPCAPATCKSNMSGPRVTATCIRFQTLSQSCETNAFAELFRRSFEQLITIV